MFLLEQVVNGLVLGGYYLLIALGLSLIFSVGGVVNLAHGAFYAFGAYASLEFAKYLGFGPALVLSPVFGALLAAGAAWYRRFLRLSSPNRSRPPDRSKGPRPGDGRTRTASQSQKASAKR